MYKEDSTRWWWLPWYLVGRWFSGILGTPRFQTGRDVGSGQQGQAAPGYLFRENFDGFSFLEGTLELFHFKGAKISLFLGLGNEPIVHEFKCTLIYPFEQS